MLEKHCGTDLYPVSIQNTHFIQIKLDHFIIFDRTSSGPNEHFPPNKESISPGFFASENGTDTLSIEMAHGME